MKYFTSKVTFLLAFLKRPNLICDGFFVLKMKLSPGLFLSLFVALRKILTLQDSLELTTIALAGITLKAILQPQLLEF